MTKHLAVALWAMVAWGCGAEGGTSSDAEDDDQPVSESEDPEVEGIVALHNEVRAEVGQAPLKWSPEAAKVAKEYAQRCEFSHNAARGELGENLFASTAVASAADVVGGWASEKANYDYENNSCSGVCGHYTQIVWGATEGVGCARQRCQENSPFKGREWEIWVCNYAPPGNYVGQRPY